MVWPSTLEHKVSPTPPISKPQETVTRDYLATSPEFKQGKPVELKLPVGPKESLIDKIGKTQSSDAPKWQRDDMKFLLQQIQLDAKSSSYAFDKYKYDTKAARNLRKVAHVADGTNGTKESLDRHIEEKLKGDTEYAPTLGKGENLTEEELSQAWGGTKQFSPMESHRITNEVIDSWEDYGGDPGQIEDILPNKEFDADSREFLRHRFQNHPSPFNRLTSEDTLEDMSRHMHENVRMREAVAKLRIEGKIAEAIELYYLINQAREFVGYPPLKLDYE